MPFQPHHRDDNVTVFHGDCLAVMPNLIDYGFDAVITDPPYELAFMGKQWDGSGIAFDVEVWRNCFRLLKPGGHLLAFGGTRTHHRLACAIEDAGFEIRDSIAWLYGSGFPKSLDVSKAIDKAAGAEREVTDAAKQWQGWGTALKPAFEPIIVARKPLDGTVANNVQRYDTGAFNIDATRVGVADGFGGGSKASSGYSGIDGYEGGFVPSTQGRWPANVLLDGDMADQLDQQSGVSGPSIRKHTAGNEAGVHSVGAVGVDVLDGIRGHADSGGASRFFPTFRYQAKAPKAERPNIDGVAHPTVKPLELMRWLVKLVTPPDGVVFDPFAGSGTTAEACIAEGMRCTVIEQEQDYLPLIVHRIDRANRVVRQQKRREHRNGHPVGQT